MLTAGKGLTREDSTLAVAPLFHIGGLGLYTLPLLYAGGRVVVQDAFVPERTLELLAEHGITVQFMVPAMWDALSKLPNFDDYDLCALRCLLCGGAPCPLPVIDHYQSKGFTFMEGFGMTELSPTALVLEAEFVRSHAGSVGRPFLHTDIRIVDEQDKDVEVGEVGELVLRGPNVFAGYWGLPEVTAEAKRGGWFHSGDLARQDAEGFVTLVDRKKDMVISGGENVYPIEVELVLYRHPDVAEVAVIGVPDEKWGETVVAVIATREGAELDGESVIPIAATASRTSSAPGASSSSTCCRAMRPESCSSVSCARGTETLQRRCRDERRTGPGKLRRGRVEHPRTSGVAGDGHGLHPAPHRPESPRLGGPGCPAAHLAQAGGGPGAARAGGARIRRRCGGVRPLSGRERGTDPRRR